MLKIQPFNTNCFSQKQIHKDKKTYFNSKGDSFCCSKSADNVSFGLLCRMGRADWPIDTDFFRGVKTYQKAASYIVKQWSKGTTILVGAGSSGQDALTLKMLLNQKGKSAQNNKIISLDIDTDAIRIGKEGKHSVVPFSPDGFLINEELELTEAEKQLKKIFFKYFVETTASNPHFHNSTLYLNYDSKNFGEQFFELKNKKDAMIEFRDAEDGDILKIDEFEPDKPVGVISFRNGTYQLTNNNIKRLKFDGRLSRYTPQLEVLDKFAQKVHSRLENNGILVLGNFIGEHIYTAPAKTPESKTIKLVDTSFYNRKIMQAMTEDYYKEIRFLKQSPLSIALKETGFKPIFWDSIEEIPEMKVPTIWQKP